MTDQNNKEVIIIIGPPGSGKGTQASLLSDRFGFYYFETSKIIERKVMRAKKGDVQAVEGKNYSLIKERKKWETGDLCSPPLVSFWVKERIRELAQENKGIVFAGSPRTVYEAEQIMPVLEELYGKKNIRIILFELKPEDSIWRNSNRRICELMRHPILYNKETEALTKCPLDGSRLIRRGKLDDLETIKIRLKEYQEHTFPVIEHLEREGFGVVKIDASPSPAEVFKRVLEASQLKL